MPTLACCATLNNYTPSDVATLRTPRAELQYIIVGHEVGENNTPHLQIYFQLRKQTKFTTIKNWGGPWARMHLEGARGTSDEAADYCKKEGNFFEVGEQKKMGRKGARNDIESLKAAIENGESFDDICSHSFETVARYTHFIRERIVARDNQIAKDKMRENYSDVVWRPWQQRLLSLLDEPLEARKIMWFWDEKGAQGKSYLSTFLALQKNACVMGQGKKADLAHIWAEHPGPTWPIVIFDVARSVVQNDTEKKPIAHLLSLAEEMKNGRVTSTKYGSKIIFRPPPHVVFFANFPPERELLSTDRWCVHHLN